MDAIDSAHSIRCAITVGTSRPLYCTAAGQVLLAFADEEFQEEFLRSVELVRRTPVEVRAALGSKSSTGSMMTARRVVGSLTSQVIVNVTSSKKS